MKKNCTHISQFNQSDRPKIATNWKLWHSVLNQIWLFAKISKSWLVPILQGILAFLRNFFWKITTGSLSKCDYLNLPSLQVRLAHWCEFRVHFFRLRLYMETLRHMRLCNVLMLCCCYITIKVGISKDTIK